MALTEAIRAEILRLDAEGHSPKQIRMALGLSKGTIAGELYRHRNKADNAPRGENKIVAFPSLPKPVVIKRAENETTDMARWESERDRLLSSLRLVRVMNMNDVHFPFHDESALALWMEMARRFEPHIVSLGDDAFDYPTLSSFEADHDISVDDWQEQSREYWSPLIHTLDRLLPNATFVYKLGNHERRALKAIKASDSPKVGMRYFLETIRCGGRVLYVGRTEHHEIGGLVVAHGNKASKFAADKMGLMWPDKTVNFGHIHKHQAFGNAFSNGMLCQKIAHYDDWGYPTNQEQGTSIMTVDTQTNRVLWSHSKFEQGRDGLMAQYGNELISTGQAVAESEAA